MSEKPKIETKYYNQESVEKVEIKSKWWGVEPESMYMHIFGVIKKIRSYQSYRSLNNIKFARLYCNMDMLSLSGGQFARTPDPVNFMRNRVTYNVVKSCVDTVASKIGKMKPRPMYLTADGQWLLQQRAKDMTDFMSGQFDCIGTGQGEDRTMYGLGRQAFTDSCVWGTGVVKFYKDEAKAEVKAERVIIDEIIVDDTEGRYRAPRQLHQVKAAFREVILDMFPDHREKIKAAPSCNREDSAQSSADMIEIAESWHLPSGHDSKDGKHVISIENCTLFHEDFTKQRFPFVFYRWSLRPLGFFGGALTEELVGIQLEINKILRTIQIAQHLMAVPQVWLEIASKTITKQINNEIGGIKFYTGKEPLFFTPNAMSAEMYQHLETLYEKAFQITGVSLLSAQSQKPSGLDSGKALREYQDIESERFASTSQAYEDFYMDCESLIRDLLDDLVETGKKPIVKIRENNFSKQVSWKDIRIKEDMVSVRAYPTSFLSGQPSARFQDVQELVQGGFYEKDEALDLLDYPDLQKVNSLKLSPRADLMRMIETMLKDNGEYQTPEPYMKLEYGRDLAQRYYLRGRCDGMPEERLEMLRRFMDDCKALIDKAKAEAAAAEQAAMMAAQGGMPAPEGMPMDPMADPLAAPGGIVDGMEGGIPAAAPVSELLPNVPA